ncbi:MAG TPA: phytanoyl-CoA dioxygenase family protein [Chlamydiales bacterium]|nr:phytanoyl-CoA dioxygenase family protein [Chlamydiales bacterium]
MRFTLGWTAFFINFCFSILTAVEMKGFLTPEDIAVFYKQGYLLKPKALSQTEMNQLNETVTTVVNRALEQIHESPDVLISAEEQFLYINGSRVVFKRHPDNSASIARINGCSGIEPALLETVRSEKMLHTFFELLGTSDIEHLISQIHPKLPGDNIAFPKHRDIQFRKSFDPDWQDVLGNGSYAICIIPIEPMTSENGGLWIDANNYPEPQELDEERIWIYAEPGDLLFMHPYLYHGSEPNFSPIASRKTLLTGFCAFGANHKSYPGAHVNTRLTLVEENSIFTTPAPWSQTPCICPAIGH